MPSSVHTLDATTDTEIMELAESEFRLSRDMVAAAKTLQPREARFLVSSYYRLQESRIRAGHQLAKLQEFGEPHFLLDWTYRHNAILEKQVARALKVFAEENALGEWALSVHGIGPIITAGLLAHIDLEKAPTVGHIWRFAGLDPTVVWKEKQRRPWNAELKTLCWKIGQSFMKTSGSEKSFYGKVYRDRKALEMKRNESGDFSEQARAALGSKRAPGKDTEAFEYYSKSQLPPGRIELRAERYAVKLFLAHYHEQGYRLVLKKEPPKPYVIEHMGHAHYIAPPLAGCAST